MSTPAEDPYASRVAKEEDEHQSCSPAGGQQPAVTDIGRQQSPLVIYHTLIETCKMCGVSTLEYFKEFFNTAFKREQFRMYSRNVEREQFRLIIKAVMQGRTDEGLARRPKGKSTKQEQSHARMDFALPLDACGAYSSSRVLRRRR